MIAAPANARFSVDLPGGVTLPNAERGGPGGHPLVLLEQGCRGRNLALNGKDDTMSGSMAMRVGLPEAATPRSSGNLESGRFPARRQLADAFGRFAALLSAERFPEAVEASDRDLERLSRRQGVFDAVGQQRIDVLRRVGRI